MCTSDPQTFVSDFTDYSFRKHIKGKVKYFDEMKNKPQLAAVCKNNLQRVSLRDKLAKLSNERDAQEPRASRERERWRIIEASTRQRKLVNSEPER